MCLHYIFLKRSIQNETQDFLIKEEKPVYNMMLLFNNKISKFKLDKETDNKIKRMFMQIIDIHDLHERKNFLNINFIIYKLFKLLEMNECMEKFPIYKNKNILNNNDKIWKDICTKLNWTFIKTD